VLLCADQFGANNIAELRGMLAIKDRRNREEAQAKKARQEAEAAALRAIERDAALREEAKIPALF